MTPRAPTLRAGRLALVCAMVGCLASPAAAAAVKIGVAAPLTGSDAVFGSQVRRGVEQAIADLDASGGILGQRATMVLGDDVGDPKRGTDIAAGFVRDKLPLIVGPFSSSVTLPSSAVYAEGGLLEITPAATAPRITERGLATVFRLAGRDDQQSLVAARFLNARHYSRIAILHDRTTQGKDLADAVRKALAADGVKDVLYAGINKGDRDFAPLVARLKAAGAQVAYWGGTQTEAGLLARQLHDANAHVTLMGGIGIASEDFATLAGPGAEGTLMTFPADPKLRDDAHDLLERLRGAGTEPEAYTFYAYAAVQIFAQAAEATRSLDAAVIAKAMHEGMVFRTVLGDISFDAKGDVTVPDFVVYVWRRGPSGRVGFYDLAGLSPPSGVRGATSMSRFATKSIAPRPAPTNVD